MKKISQAEARRLKKRVEELERQRRVQRQRWDAAFPGGVNFHTITVHETTKTAVDVALRLDHAVVCKLWGDQLKLYAVK